MYIYFSIIVKIKSVADEFYISGASNGKEIFYIRIIVHSRSYYDCRDICTNFSV